MSSCLPKTSFTTELFKTAFPQPPTPSPCHGSQTTSHRIPPGPVHQHGFSRTGRDDPRVHHCATFSCPSPRHLSPHFFLSHEPKHTFRLWLIKHPAWHWADERAGRPESPGLAFVIGFLDTGTFWVLLISQEQFDFFFFISPSITKINFK